MPEVPVQQTAQQPNIQAPTTAKTSKPKWNPLLLAILIGATLIFAGAIAYYYFGLSSNTPPPAPKTPKATTTPAKKDETAGWKVHTNNKFGYSIKYPNGWFVDDKGIYTDQTCKSKAEQNVSKEPQRNVAIHDNADLKCVSFPVYGLLFIQVSDNKVSSLSSYKEGVRQGEITGNCGTVTTKFITVDGEQAVKMEYSFNECGGFRSDNTIWLNHKGQGFKISVPINKTGKEDAIYNTILSTFKFLD